MNGRLVVVRWVDVRLMDGCWIEGWLGERVLNG